MDSFVKILFFLLVVLIIILLLLIFDFTTIFFKKKIYFEDVNISFKEKCNYTLKLNIFLHKNFMKFKIRILSNGKIDKYKTLANISQEVNYNYFNYSKSLNIGSVLLQQKFENIKNNCNKSIVYTYKERELTVYEMVLNEKCLKNVLSNIKFQGYNINIEKINSKCKFYTKSDIIEKIICNFEGTTTDVSFNGDIEVTFT